MTALADIPKEIWDLAFGLFRGDMDRVLGVFRVAFVGESMRVAADDLEISYSQIHRDRRLFSKLLEDYKGIRDMDRVLMN